MSKQPEQLRGADRRKYHIIYRTTCLVTDRYYVGMHSTDDLNDGYIGSGKRLWRSIKKYGAEQHVCEVLEHLPSREALRAREEELVNEQLLEDKRCMNLVCGGGGGSFSHHTEDTKEKLSTNAKRLWENQKYRLLISTRQSILTSKHWKENEAYRKNRLAAWIDAWKNQSAEEKNLLSEKHKQLWTAEKRAALSLRMKEVISISNPSTGRPWIYHPISRQSKKISSDELNTWLLEGWIKGRCPDQFKKR